jgi:hypothetical protein
MRLTWGKTMDAAGQASRRSSFLEVPGAEFFSGMEKTRHDALEILPPPGLRFALNASPSGRRRASLRPGGGRQQVVHFSDYRRTEIINPTSSEINLLPEKNGLDNGVHRKAHLRRIEVVCARAQS